MSIFRDFSSSAGRHGAPVTVALVVALIAAFLLIWMRVGVDLLAQLAFSSLDAGSKPWTLVTYPYVTDVRSFIGLVFLCLWIWGIGGSVERELGSGKYLGIWVLFSALCALGLWLGALLLGTPTFMSGAWTPVAAITVIWGTRNSTAQVMLMFVLPINGKWLAWLSVGLVFFGTEPPQMAPFAAAPLALAYLFAANKLAFLAYGRGGIGRPNTTATGPGGRRIYKKEYYDDVKRREQARQEKERLRKLFEQSVHDEREADDK
jgi:membrane associated rhomboid family serine protease